MGSLVFRDADIEYFLLGYPGVDVGAGAGVPLSGLSVTIFLELQISIK